MPTINIEVAAQVDDAVRGLANVSTTFNSFQHANQDAAGALGVFGVSLTALNNPITLVAGALKDSMDTALHWGETVDKLAAASGQSTQAASTMATVFGDFGVQTDSLDKIIKQFTKNGLQFNMDTIESLAAQYQAIQDPVAKDKFAFDNFGRSALDMNDILSASPQKLHDMADAAQYSGKVVDEQMVQSMQDASVKAQQLNDKLDGLKIMVGGPVVDVLSNAATGFTGLVATINAADIAVEAHTGMITWDEAAARSNAAAHGDLFAAFHNATQATTDQTAAVGQLNSNTNTLTANTGQLTGAELAASTAIAEANAKTAESNALTAVDTSLQGELTTQIIFQTASEGLNAAGKLELARSLGLVNENTYAAEIQIQGWKQQLQDGTLTQDEFTRKVDGLNDSLGKIGGTLAPGIAAVVSMHDKLDALPTQKTVNVDVNTNYHGAPYHDQNSGSGMGGAANGADFVVPPGYPNDSYMLPVQSGEHVVVTPAGQASTTNHNGHTFNVTINSPTPVDGPGLMNHLSALANSY